MQKVRSARKHKILCLRISKLLWQWDPAAVSPLVAAWLASPLSSIQCASKLSAKRTFQSLVPSKLIQNWRSSSDLYMAAVSLSLMLGGIWKPSKRGDAELGSDAL